MGKSQLGKRKKKGSLSGKRGRKKKERKRQKTKILLSLCSYGGFQEKRGMSGDVIAWKKKKRSEAKLPTEGGEGETGRRWHDPRSCKEGLVERSFREIATSRLDGGKEEMSWDYMKKSRKRHKIPLSL